NPAAPSTSAPVQTDVTYFAFVACRRRNSRISASSIIAPTPGPPGTKRRSTWGTSLIVLSGTTVRPLCAVTGCSDLATTLTLQSGILVNTSCGPAKSRCVRSGNISMPMIMAVLRVLSPLCACACYCSTGFNRAFLCVRALPLIEQQHEVGEEQEKMHRAEEHIRACARERQHRDSQCQHQQHHFGRPEAENDLPVGYESDHQHGGYCETDGR